MVLKGQLGGSRGHALAIFGTLKHSSTRKERHSSVPMGTLLNDDCPKWYSGPLIGMAIFSEPLYKTFERTTCPRFQGPIQAAKNVR